MPAPMLCCRFPLALDVNYREAELLGLRGRTTDDSVPTAAGWPRCSNRTAPEAYTIEMFDPGPLD